MNRILIAEDDLYLKTLFAKAFRHIGYHVDTVVDGDQAINYLNQQMPDVLVLDIGLPGPNGLEIMQYVRRHEHHMRQSGHNMHLNIIVVTGNADHKQSEVSSLCDAFMLKPVSTRDLVACVQQFADVSGVRMLTSR